jgi:hypothetical protein
MHKSLLIVLASAAFVLGGGCSGKRGPEVGGESHWLASCGADRDCGDGQRCLCGTCTHACSTDTACAGGLCYNASSPLLLERCDTASLPSQGICLLECTSDADCGSARTCEQGACLTRAGDAGSLELGGSVSDQVDWTSPVQEPALETTIAGADASLLGTWHEAACDETARENKSSGCAWLVIAAASGNALTGTLYFGLEPQAWLFRPASDPDHGYPTELPPDSYVGQLGLQRGVAYRVLDGVLQDGHFTFAWSPYALWQDWCALQTPFEWHVGERSFYFCVPQDPAAQAAIDTGKDRLCTSPDFGPLCRDDQGNSLPCLCTGPDASGRCTPAFCHCTAARCDANTLGLLNADLTLSNDHITGRLSALQSAQAGYFSVDLTRVSP